MIAGEKWGVPMKEIEVPQAREESIEYMLHHQNADDRYLLFNTEDISEQYETAIKHRAIGVVYDPYRERFENYVPLVMAQRYDAFIFLDETKALHPLGLPAYSKQMPETFPFGL